MRLGVYSVLFAMCLTYILFTVNGVAGSLESIEKKMSEQERTPEFRMEPQYLIAPPREGGTNRYYEGFFRDYGDGEIHPHRQALMLLLSHLASLAERPAVTDLDTTGDEKD